MPDSTDHLRRLATAATVSLALAVLTVLAVTGTALADGDPASDVLASQRLFLPQDGVISATQQSELTAIAAAAQRAGFPVRVALIATATDLGSVTALWRHPDEYARFLAVELPQVFRGTLLVVMPNGVGVARVGAGSGPSGASGSRSGAGGSRSGAGAALAGLPAPGSQGSLATVALTAVQRLAAAAGHRLSIPFATGSAPLPSARSSRGRSFDLAAWAALAIGAALIAAAWMASLRVRPLRRRDGVGSPHGS